MKIYFSRHGESQANIVHEISNRGLKHGLTRKGRAHAEDLARRLAGLPIHKIYSSPVLRAIETSIIVANRLDLEYEVTDALREYDCGIAEGRSDEIGWQMWRDNFDAWAVHNRLETRIEGGESFYDIRDRFVPFVEGLVRQYQGSDESPLCISHGGTYLMMLPLVLRNIDRDFLSTRKIGYTTVIEAELRPAGLVCVSWDGEKI
jgi:broad specificity phosphatase PhoE